MNIGEISNRTVVLLLKWWTTPIFRYGVKSGKAYAEIFPAFDDEENVDERIKKIDEARDNLVSALSAVDELKHIADLNKQKAHELQKRLDELSVEKVAADKELGEVRKITSTDVSTFRRVAGVPTRKQIGKERLVGFGLGITASLLATVVWEKWPVVMAWFQA